MSSCYARLEDGVLSVGNAVFGRQYRCEYKKLELSQGTSVVGIPFLGVRAGKYEFKIWESLAAVGFRSEAITSTLSPSGLAEVTGVEVDEKPEVALESLALETFELPHPHFKLIQAVLRDQTDIYAEVLQENEWLLAPNESNISLQGNAFCLEDTFTGEGTIFIKHAPLPSSRPVPEKVDFRVRNGRSVEFFDGGFWCATILYSGGKIGRLKAIQNYFRTLRKFDSNRDALFLSNTWGDRSRDAHLSPEFMEREIEAGSRLGVEVVQIDDGWQQGITANSAKSNGKGAWDGFWASDPDFWKVNTARFPDGLEPLIEQARAKGMRFGLWFAPDSSHDAANWERDAEALIGLHRNLGIDFFKIDALKIESEAAISNFEKFFDKVLRESNGKITFDLDITAEKRFGYFGLPEPGNLFVQNRYTDWGRYYPHYTLRVLWQLAHWTLPSRLRLEWLNVERNKDKYPNDPLAPSQYTPDVLFATVMLGAPLGWFEVQNLPQSYFESAAPLITKWKAEREKWQEAVIIPIGDKPDGIAYTGFQVLGDDYCDLLIFRGANESSQWKFTLESSELVTSRLQTIYGDGKIVSDKEGYSVEIPNRFGFLWVRLY
jgi:alpha-galactosidase